MEWLAAAYADPMYWKFPVVGTLISLSAFLAFALPLTLMAAWAPQWLERHRIQSRRPSNPRRMVLEALGACFLNHGALFVYVSAAWPVVRMFSRIHDGPLPAWWVAALQVVFIFYLHDFLYYFFHRFLHAQPWLWKRIHTWHHRIRTPWAICGYDMHPLEFCLSATLVLQGPLWLGVHVYVLWLWVALRTLDAAEGHCGYQIPFSPLRWLPGSDGARHHDFHHGQVRGNYASYLYWTDRLFGTMSKGYAPKGRGQDAQKKSP